MNYIKTQKNMFKKTLLTIVLVLLFFPASSYAETVQTTPTVPFRSFDSNPYSFEGLSLANIYVYNLNTNIKVNLYKNIFLRDSEGGNISSNSSLQIGDTVTLFSEPTYGDYVVAGYGSKPINDTLYNKWKHSWSHVTHTMALFTKVYSPVEDITPVLESENESIIDCNDNTCTVVGLGTTDINVIFPTTQYQGASNAILDYYDAVNSAILILLGRDPYLNFAITNKGSLFYGSDTNFGKIQLGAVSTRSTGSAADNLTTMTYTFPPIKYTIIGDNSIPKPITSCVSPTATQDSITINWAHTDNGAGSQSQYVVELALDPSFSNRVDGGTGTTNTSHTFTDLTANTKYYARVQTKGNNSTEMSEWSSCGEITTTQDPQPGTFSVSCSANPSFVTIPSGSSSYTGNIEFTVSPRPDISTYRWVNSDGNQVGSVNNPYTLTSITTTGASSFSVPRTVHATSTDGQVDSDTCSVNVTDANVPFTPPGGGNTPTTSFYFRPDITNGVACPLHLTATNVVSCELRNRSGSPAYTYSPQTGTTISFSGNEYVDKGQYRLWCTGTAVGAVPQEFGTPQTCSSNFDIKED